jgi:hypothetical protein
MSDQKRTLEKEFEAVGEEGIRLQLQNGQITGQMAIYATQWLGERAQMAEARKDASNRETINIARSAKNAAWAAATAAIVAAIAAVVAIVISLGRS